MNIIGGILIGIVVATIFWVTLLRVTRTKRVRPVSQRAIAQVHQIYDDGSSVTLIENDAS